MPGKRRRYVILRDDGLLLHTKPVTWWEARWLLWVAYITVEDLSLRARYLAEWGNVLDVGDYAEHLWSLRLGEHHSITDVYGSPEEFEERVRSLLSRGDLQPEAKQMAEELLGKAKEFLRRPVEPKPIEAPVRYFEMPARHVVPGPGGSNRTVPEAKWYAKVTRDSFRQYGISVFDDAIWLWRQIQVAPRQVSARQGPTEPKGIVWAVAVRRDAPDGDVIAALANDDVAAEFLFRGAEYFNEVINMHRMELTDNGYEDVARKAKAILTAAQILKAGRYRKGEEEEALPA